MTGKKDFKEDTAIYPDLKTPKAEVSEPQEAPKIQPVKTSKKQEEPKLIQRSYYITEVQNRALGLRKALTKNAKEKDVSAIVRLALDRYLKDEIQQITE